MGGLFGAVKKMDCVRDVYYGTDYNSHLGTSYAGLAFFSSNSGIFSLSENIDNSTFRAIFECKIDLLKANAGIGVISDTDSQPVVVAAPFGSFAIVTVGKINNREEIIEKYSLNVPSDCPLTRLVASLIAKSDNIVNGIEKIQDSVKGSCSILILLDDGTVFGARDRLGRTPIVLARSVDANGWALSSESCAFDNLGYEKIRDLGPGEIIKISQNGPVVIKKPGHEMQICAFLWTYYGYPTSDYEDRNVDEMRMTLGKKFGEKDDVDVDFVSSVPDSGIGMALGYSQGNGAPYKRGLVKYTPSWPRSFMPTTQNRRDLVAKMKLIANKSLLEGKNVVFCDDSIVRGTQLGGHVADIRRCRVASLHVRISCPPIIFPCPFLNFSFSESKMELITRRVIAEIEGNPDSDVEKYADQSTPQYRAMVEKIRRNLNLDSLKFSSIGELVDAIGLPKCRICTHCFDASSHF